MKKIILSAAFFGAMLVFNQAQAQPGISVQIQVGTAPAWIPSGYNNADYYYLPDIQTYYYVPQRQFIYMDGGRWMFAASLPAYYRSYDLYHGYKVAMTEPRPYLHDNIYRERYREGPAYYRRPEYRPEYRHDAARDRSDHGNGHGHAYGHRR
ncbi:MAG: hypothetical protein ACHQDF_04505 [Chitinophagales bacterium]